MSIKTTEPFLVINSSWITGNKAGLLRLKEQIETAIKLNGMGNGDNGYSVETFNYDVHGTHNYCVKRVDDIDDIIEINDNW